MDGITVVQAKDMLIAVCNTIIENEPRLTEIDTVIGDGDHGTGMECGFTALKEMLDANSFEDMWTLFRMSGIELVKTMGGASGVLFGTLFIGGLDRLQGVELFTTDVAAGYFTDGATAVMERGRAKLGQKTMLDALFPASDALRQAASEGRSLERAMGMAKAAADEGVEATVDMQSGVGRSRNFREKTIGYPDPGAVSISLIFGAMYEYLKALKI